MSVQAALALVNPPAVMLALGLVRSGQVEVELTAYWLACLLGIAAWYRAGTWWRWIVAGWIVAVLAGAGLAVILVEPARFPTSFERLVAAIAALVLPVALTGLAFAGSTGSRPTLAGGALRRFRRPGWLVGPLVLVFAGPLNPWGLASGWRSAGQGLLWDWGMTAAVVLGPATVMPWRPGVCCGFAGHSP